MVMALERRVINEFGIPLRKVLELPLFSNSKVRAGEDGLDNIVTGVNIMEVPDIDKWVKPGQLLVTTGYAIQNDKKAQQNLITILARRGASGLFIKTKRYLEEIPDPILMKARFYNFPVVELSFDISFDEVIHDVLSAILCEQSAQLMQMLNIHSILMKIMFEGGGLKKIADTLSAMVENPVYIIDRLNDREVYSFGTNQDQETEQLINAIRDKKKIGDHENGRVVLNVQGTKISCFCMPILVANEFYGKIRVYESGRPLTNQDIQIVEQMMILTALEISREHSVRTVERRYFNEFLTHILNGRIDDEEKEIEHAQKFGWDMRRNYIVALVFLCPQPDGGSSNVSSQEFRHRVGIELPKKLQARGVNCLIGSVSDYLVLLLDMGEEIMPSRQIVALAKKHLKTVLGYLKESFHDCRTLISLGRFHPGVRGIQQSYQEAKRALQVGEKLLKKGEILSFEDLSLYRFIFSADQDKEIKSYIQETLGKLIRYDQEKNTDLIRTLQVYFHCNGNLKKMSEMLYTHYNTVLYRLERIKEITGYDLDSPDDRFNLEVALRLLPGVN